MRYILLLVMLFSLKANSQNDTLFITGTPIIASDLLTSDTILTHGVFSNSFYFKNRKDTVRIIMLVSDTSNFTYTDSAINNGRLVQVGEVKISYLSDSVFWVYGYAVVSYFWGNEYLDDKKKPLSKNIVVWLAKPI